MCAHHHVLEIAIYTLILVGQTLSPTLSKRERRVQTWPEFVTTIQYIHITAKPNLLL